MNLVSLAEKGVLPNIQFIDKETVDWIAAHQPVFTDERIGSTFLLATTYIREAVNRDTRQGKWRPINLNKDPFNLPSFIKHISTDFRNKGKNHPGNGMALWRISDLKNRLCDAHAPRF